jgi:hypothetical protein
MSEKCPFKVGDMVMYRPNIKSNNSGTSKMLLQEGRSYKIAQIKNDVYVVVEGDFSMGIYWTEFSSIGARQKCPFKVGDEVFYRPTNKGSGSIVMTDLAALQRGNKYKIARIEDDVYVVPEGFENAIPCSLYWTEFSAE